METNLGSTAHAALAGDPGDPGPADPGSTGTGPAYLGQTGTGPTDLGPTDLGPADLGPADLGRPDGVALPRIGMVGAWFDPYDRRTWSGIPSNLIAELDRLGVFAGYHDVTPWPRVTRAVFKWLASARRRSGNWPTSPEMRAVASLANAVSRRRLSRRAEAWVVPAGGFGRPVAGRVVTLSEVPPAQLQAIGPARAAAFGMAGLSGRGLAAVVRQQAGLHRHAHACCVASSWAAEGLVRDHGVPPEKVHVVGYGRNVDIPPSPHRRWDPPRFLFVGHDWARKNGDAVVRAFVRLRSEVPDAHLDVVGHHPPLDVAGVTAHGRLGFERPEERDRLERLFGQATCFVMPSWMEPFGIVHVEAGAAGLPSIGTTVGGTATSVGDGGLLVDPGDDGAIHRAMCRLADPSAARTFGRRALARSGSFTWPKVAERILRATDLLPADAPLAGYL